MKIKCNLNTHRYFTALKQKCRSYKQAVQDFKILASSMYVTSRRREGRTLCRFSYTYDLEWIYKNFVLFDVEHELQTTKD